MNKAAKPKIKDLGSLVKTFEACEGLKRIMIVTVLESKMFWTVVQCLDEEKRGQQWWDVGGTDKQPTEPVQKGVSHSPAARQQEIHTDFLLAI